VPGRFAKFKFTFRTFIVAALVAAGLGTAASMALTPHTSSPLAKVVRPSASPTPTGAAATPTPAAPTESIAASAPTPTPPPTVAGASTQKPQPTPVKKAAAPTPAPPVNTVMLVLEYPKGPYSGQVRLLPGADACAVLEQAKSEGKLTSLNIDYTTYMNSLHSAYVKEINGYENWKFKVESGGKTTSPLGCSLVKPLPNDKITWSTV
jgi:hypothetical protein